ncbi:MULTISPECIES: hypothetical protein [unclassified Paenibacillus]|uniref:hypothetical protein n=1 Tax=unclassified Paenibacillus TaxID=185978 RepID=UPI00240655D8|nr:MULTISPECIES: hypothetical protein [unclassified Paenibacillus]MDF9839008.1 hypothetical protein [Paenibacillus sp. PastF-2]MDF9845590.1 hypothetical protein [Paenibacillus sp. PastM-2]MDF9852161.1 hypothetical protein [Paenibacillus sp. PastF-1]MDH6478109.1 hypothetical protein [Paenibacillus sp. PastH-2]MDH6505843.1 hypothetical protein [Paenibacillus sp. PastM-3]
MIAETTMHPETNTIFISLHGFADLEETVKEVDIFEAQMPHLPLKEMSLIIDCTDMAPFKPEILPVLERCYVMYNSFKHAVLVNPVKVVAKSQLQRVAPKAGFTGHFVDTVDEAWAIVKG